MKKNADDFYFFIIPMKYRLDFLNIKTARTIILTAIACYPIMYLIIKNFELDGIYLPNTPIFKCIIFFFLTVVSLSVFSFLFRKHKMYDSMVWLLTSLAFLEIAYFLILMEYLSFLRKYISIEWQALIFNILLVIPIIFIFISLGRYIRIIHTGKTHKKYPKVILLEQKFKNESDTNFEEVKSKKFILYASLIGVGLGGMIETSFTLFLVFLGCACLMSWMVPRFLIISYLKFKFPELYLEKNLKISHKKERNLKK
ncbi:MULTISPECIES: hypothetical protein [unclassified Enterococcus]|uniref:hypothetical protein n=1 Tax=unclassified Enterococcus TaxID=2608891 RepID=UPI001CE0F002|nr:MULTISPECIES: hypothetical protein [unclassified Enterococcus]MCA5014318.1 hypothetical protein [Enterococcus sp. S23]MCA5017729.1 hypothetical protein [Enterococcus sp. S22(2020)]